jgi:hypothetical protein
MWHEWQRKLPFDCLHGPQFEQCGAMSFASGRSDHPRGRSPCRLPQLPAALAGRWSSRRLSSSSASSLMLQRRPVAQVISATNHSTSRRLWQSRWSIRRPRSRAWRRPRPRPRSAGRPGATCGRGPCASAGPGASMPRRQRAIPLRAMPVARRPGVFHARPAVVTPNQRGLSPPAQAPERSKASIQAR